MTGIVNLLTKVLTTKETVTPITNITKRNNNPFENYTSSNPFVTNNPYANYGQNKPVAGGYFAGYYNNQPNIVGRRLFIEV